MTTLDSCDSVDDVLGAVVDVKRESNANTGELVSGILLLINAESSNPGTTSSLGGFCKTVSVTDSGTGVDCVVNTYLHHVNMNK